MRVAIIGCGSIGARHARNAAALGHGVMLVDADEQKAIAAKLDIPLAGGGIVHYLTLRDVVDNLPDAVMVCTPASTHATVVRQLLDVGYAGPLFVEKPLALSVEECAVFKAWLHPTTMVGYNWRFNEDVRQLLALQPRCLRTSLYCRTDMRSWPGRSYGDPLAECSHEIDLILSLNKASGPLSVFCACGYHPESPLTSHVSLSINGADVTVNWKGNVVETERSFERGPFRLVPTKSSIDDSYRLEIAHFLNCAHRRVATDIPFADGIRVLDVIEQVKAMAACAP